MVVCFWFFFFLALDWIRYQCVQSNEESVQQEQSFCKFYCIDKSILV